MENHPNYFNHRQPKIGALPPSLFFAERESLFLKRDFAVFVAGGGEGARGLIDFPVFKE